MPTIYISNAHKDVAERLARNPTSIAGKPIFPTYMHLMIFAAMIGYANQNAKAVEAKDRGPEIYEDCAGLVIGVESECAAAAVVGACLGLEMGALLFCTDNVTLACEDEHGYRGLADDRVRRGFDAGLSAIVQVLIES